MEKVLVIVSLLVLILVCCYADESRISIKNKLPLSITTLGKKRALSVVVEGGNDFAILCSNERITELLDQLSSGCKSYLTDEDGFYEFEEESTIICQSCGDTLFSFLKCLGTDPADLELFNVLCTGNENGDTCYHLMNGDGIEVEEIVSKCQDMTCSIACRDSLQNSFLQYGCCLYNLIALNTSEDMVHDMWSACGLDEPGLCVPAFNEDSSSMTSATTTVSEASELPTTSSTSTASDETTATPNTEENPTTVDTTESTTMPSEPNIASDDASTEPTPPINVPAADNNDPDLGADVASQSAASTVSSLSSAGILFAALSHIYIL